MTAYVVKSGSHALVKTPKHDRALEVAQESAECGRDAIMLTVRDGETVHRRRFRADRAATAIAETTT
jgi:hypothetical protein